MNIRLGFSISAHYRLLKRPEDVAELIIRLYNRTRRPASLEFSFYDLKSLSLFVDGYHLARPQIEIDHIDDVSMHFLRKGLTIECFDQIASHVEAIARKYDIKDIVIHYEIYQMFKKQIYSSFVEKGYLVLLENIDRRELFVPEDSYVFQDQNIDGIVLDLCHFNFISTNDLKSFLEEYPGITIREIHFSYLNHEIFRTKSDVQWLEERLKIVREYIDVDKTRFICEGTDKKSTNLKELMDLLCISNTLVRESMQVLFL